MIIKPSRIEELGLNLEYINEKDLEELVLFIEQCIKDELSKLLDQRVLEYISIISVEIVNNTINIAIDLEAGSYITPHISLESILDQVLRHVFEKTRMYLVRNFRKNAESNNK
ncbi:MAG: hypothetical protein QW775_07650 [Ignisphaera sp.]|uniref:DUF3194 domain-containing protein n=1 Tax=Ignisphaera aggregans TaxID=334771 RepID=A0A7C4NMA3_9CREN